MTPSDDVASFHLPVTDTTYSVAIAHFFLSATMLPENVLEHHQLILRKSCYIFPIWLYLEMLSNCIAFMTIWRRKYKFVYASSLDQPGKALNAVTNLLQIAQIQKKKFVARCSLGV